MKERPILFSGPMVRAILDGRKTQTRRIVTPQPVGEWNYVFGVNGRAISPEDKSQKIIQNRFGAPGDRLWVRESFHIDEPQLGVLLPKDYEPPVHYAADKDSISQSWAGKWSPSIFMPRWASRITLEITSVRVERLRAISESDAQREGWDLSNLDVYKTYDPVTMDSAVQWFRGLWDSINGKRPGCAWKDSPWVWVVEFKKI